MNVFTQKTYANSYLYSMDATNHDRNIVEYITQSRRIDKRSEEFRGVLEDVKRSQSSSVLFDVLMSDSVILCIHNTEMPRAFKVFEAKDLKNSNGKYAKKCIYIDVTGIIDYKNGYFFCKKIDILITYLFEAMSYMLYQRSIQKFLNNSNITISGTECFVALFDYVLDYLRIIGYSQNKEKIHYMVALYLLHNMMGKDIDNYAKNIATKVSGLTPTQTRAFDLYYKETDFANINRFVSFIAETFKLKGLTMEVFVTKWMYLYGQGTQYATELFTSFNSLIIRAYMGSYIVGQKQVERCCGDNMVKFCTNMLALGVAEFDRRGYMEASEVQDRLPRDKNTMAMLEGLRGMQKIPENAKFTDDDFTTKDKAKKRAKSVCAYFRSIEHEENISVKVKNAVDRQIMRMKNKNNDILEGTVEIVLKECKQYLNMKDKRLIASNIDEKISLFDSKMKEAREKDDKETATYYAKRMVELRKCRAHVS